MSFLLTSIQTRHRSGGRPVPAKPTNPPFPPPPSNGPARFPFLQPHNRTCPAGAALLRSICRSFSAAALHRHQSRGECISSSRDPVAKRTLHTFRSCPQKIRQRPFLHIFQCLFPRRRTRPYRSSGIFLGRRLPQRFCLCTRRPGGLFGAGGCSAACPSPPHLSAQNGYLYKLARSAQSKYFDETASAREPAALLQRPPIRQTDLPSFII